MRAVKVGRLQYRIVCAHFGETGHTAHVWEFKAREQAETAKSVHDSWPWERACAPWTIQAQAVTEWSDDTDAVELCLYACGRTLEGRML